MIRMFYGRCTLFSLVLLRILGESGSIRQKDTRFTYSTNQNCFPGDQHCDDDAKLLQELVQFRARDCGTNFSQDVNRGKEQNNSFSAFGMPVSELKDLSYFLRPSYELFGCELPGVPLDGTGLIRLPEKITRIKIDVGLAHYAPHAQVWLENIPGLAVFGFEPNLQAVSDMLSGRNRMHSKWGNSKSLDPKYVGSQMFLFPVALGSNRGQVNFYATKDPVCSSLLEPDVKTFTEYYGWPDCANHIVYPVAVLTLSDLLSKIPWGSEGEAGVFHIIDHMKIDTQGYDVEVLRGAGRYLTQRVLCVTAEKYARGYKEPGHTEQELIDFMQHHGFDMLAGVGVDNKGADLNFYNTNLSDWLSDVDCSAGDAFVVNSLDKVYNL